MGLINPTVPTVGQPNATEDVDVLNTLNTIVTLVNGNIDNANIASGAAVAYSKLALANSIVNADIASGAAIGYSKLASLSTGQVLLGNAGTPTATTLSGDVTVNATGVTAIGNSKITNTMMADNAIDRAEIVDDAVGENELDELAVNHNHLTVLLASQLGVSQLGGEILRGYDEVTTSEGTTSDSLTDLATVGPSVTVDVPADALVSIFAEVQISHNSTKDNVIWGIEEPTDFVTPTILFRGEYGTHVSSTPTRTFTSHIPDTLTDPHTDALNHGAASREFASWITYPATAGERTYTLKYRRFSSGTATFNDRRLWVVVTGF